MRKIESDLGRLDLGGPTPDARLERVKRAIERTEPPMVRRVLCAYVEWLSACRGVSSKGIEERVVTARRILDDWLGLETACVARLRRLRARDVERALVRIGRSGRSAYAGQALRRGMRWLLAFLVERGWIAAQLPHEVSRLSLAPKRWSPSKPLERLERLVMRVPQASCRRVLRRYGRWLDRVHRLAATTSERRLVVASRLLKAWVRDETGCVRALRRLRVADVERTFLALGHDAGRGARRELQAGMRRFLGFCADQGWVPAALPGAVPRLRTYRLSTVPRCVSEADLSRLIALVKGKLGTARDRAVVLVLVTYGVRRGQIAALRLRDIDWRRRRITFGAHKGGRTVQHALSAPVAEALVEYMRVRPSGSDSVHVFLSACRPYLGISPGAVTVMIRNLLAQAGVASCPRGPHAIRHAFATRLLAARQPFKVIADLLGHRSLSSTAIYTKVDRPFLAEAPLEWPEVLR